MKVKIKGLVFVGFAAAILSANAMADDANTVTSKSYVDAKVVNNVTAENIDKAPSVGAVKTALGLKQDIHITDESTNHGKVLIVDDNGDIAIGSTSASGSYQQIADADFQIGMDNGEWKTLVDGTNTTVGTTAGGDVKIDVAEMGAAAAGTAGTVGLVPASSAGDQDKVLTAGKTWVAKQNEQTATTKYQVSLNKAWVDASGAVTVPSSGSYLERTPNTTDGSVQLNIDSNKINNTGAAVANATNANDSLVTDYTLSEAIRNATGGTKIPAQNSTICSATTPCALVSEAGELHWYTMATANNNGGTLGDYCTTNADCTLSGYTCNTTSNACTTGA